MTADQAASAQVRSFIIPAEQAAVTQTGGDATHGAALVLAAYLRGIGRDLEDLVRVKRVTHIEVTAGAGRAQRLVLLFDDGTTADYACARGCTCSVQRTQHHDPAASGEPTGVPQ